MIPQVLAGLPPARDPEDDVLRTLAVYDWLGTAEFNGVELTVGYDECGRRAELAGAHPFFQLEVSLEDMGTRPATISRFTVELATTHHAHAQELVAQWLPHSGEIDIHEIIQGRAGRMHEWSQMIHAQEVEWFSKRLSNAMAVILVEDRNGDAVGMIECMDEVVALDQRQREIMITGKSPEQLRVMGSILQDAFPHVGLSYDCSITLHFTMPSQARLAKIQARKIDQATVMVASVARGPRL